MIIKNFVSTYPRKDEEGDPYWKVNVLPKFRVEYNNSLYCMSISVGIGWLFWDYNVRYLKIKV